MKEDAYIILTPYGVLELSFPEDGGCTMDGDEDAATFFEDFLDGTVGPLGITLSLRSLEPGSLMDFCNQPEKGVSVLPPLDASMLQRELENDPG